MTDELEPHRARLSHDELVALLADTGEYRNELRMQQIEPVCAQWPYAAELRLRADQDEAALRLYCDMSSWVQLLLDHREERRCFELYQSADRTYVGYGNLFRAIAALAPFLEDVRFVISDWSEDWVDEYEIRGGALRVSRGFHEEDLDYWSARVASAPDDEGLRRFAARSHVEEVQEPLRQLDRLAGPPRAQAIAAIRAALERAAALDATSAELWHARGRLARAAGELEEAERMFARFAELSPEGAAVAELDRALTAFTAGDAARARALLDAALSRGLEHSGARLLAAHLADEPEAAAAHTAALLGIIEARRRAMPPLDEAQRGLVWIAIEPSQEDLIRTGQHAALLERCRANFTACAPAQRAAAAAYLLGWAEIFRIRVAHDRGKAEAAALASQLYAAAAALDPRDPEAPLGGSIAYYHALFLDKKSPAGVARLEAGLLLDPDHLCILGELGAAARKAGDLPRAIELLERYVANFRRLHRGGPFGLYWDFHRNELWTAHYQRACLALYGVPPGAPRPPGRPTDEALAAAEAALAPALTLADELPSSSQPKARAAALQCASLIAEHRGDHAAALAWVERALADDAQSAHAWSTKGGCLNNLGRLDEAVACCARALELDEKLWHPSLVLACVAAKQGGPRDELLTRLRRVLELWPEGRGELASEPDLASLRDDPAFRELVREPE